MISRKFLLPFYLNLMLLENNLVFRFQFFFGGAFFMVMPISVSSIASLIAALSCGFEGRSEILVIFPKENMEFFSMFLVSTFMVFISFSSQNPKAQCCLNADIEQRILPLYIKLGKLHFQPSSTSGAGFVDEFS